MNQKSDQHVIDILFVIALFCIFALSAIFLISIGANVYSKTVSHMDSNFNSRTSFAYVTEKIRQSDANNDISIGELNGLPALVITKTIGDNNYLTYLYAHEGYLKELMVREDTPLGPDAGQIIFEVTDFSLTQVNNSLFSFSITTDNENTCELFVSIKATGGDVYGQ